MLILNTRVIHISWPFMFFYPLPKKQFSKVLYLFFIQNAFELFVMLKTYYMRFLFLQKNSTPRTYSNVWCSGKHFTIRVLYDLYHPSKYIRLNGAPYFPNVLTLIKDHIFFSLSFKRHLIYNLMDAMFPLIHSVFHNIH